MGGSEESDERINQPFEWWSAECIIASPMSSADIVVLLVQPERDDRDMYAEYLRQAGLTLMVVSTRLRLSHSLRTLASYRRLLKPT
jgi:hypothetical protein